jgi:hypothetical protein
MASKQEIIRDIRNEFGNMLNISKLAKVFGCERHSVSTYVAGLPYLQEGKEKKYLALDVGRRIFERMVDDAS